MTTRTITLTSGGATQIAHTRISDDGRYVAYTVNTSNGDQLVTKDLLTGASQIIETTGSIYEFGLSADGRYIAYFDQNSTGDTVRLWDRSTSTSQTVISGPASSTGYINQDIDFSSDGRYVVLNTNIPGTAPGQSAFPDDIQIAVQTGAGQVLQQHVQGESAQSSDGRYVLIGNYGAYSRLDNETGASIPLADPSANAQNVTFSGDGRYAVFETSAALVAGDTNGLNDIYLKDFTTGELRLVSTTSDGTIGSGGSSQAVISADGSRVAFLTQALNLAPEASYGQGLAIKDLATGILAHFAVANETSGADVRNLDISADGLAVAFVSTGRLASNANSSTDAYVLRMTQPTIAITSIAGDGYVNAAEAGSPIIITGTSNDHNSQIEVTSPSGATAFTTVGSDGTWSVKVPASGVADGIHAFTATVTDEVAAFLTATTSQYGIFDTVAPTLTVDPVTADNVINAAEATQIPFLHGSSDAIGQSVTVSIDGFVAGQALVGQQGNWQLGFAIGLSDGQHSIDAVVTDPAGNVTHRSTSYEVDTTPPKVAILSVAGDDVVSQTEGKGLVPVVGTSDAIGQTVTITTGGQVLGKAVVQQDGSWTAQVSLAGAHDETSVVASVADAVGNVGTGTATVLVDADTVRISVGTHGEQGEGDPDTTTGYALDSLTPDGHYALIHTVGHTTLVPSSDPDFTSYELLKDLQTGTLTVLDHGYNGELSETGRELFQDADDGSLRVHDIATGSVSVIDANYATNHTGADFAHISTDGRYVIFDAPAGEFGSVPGADAATPVIVVDDLQTGTIRALTSPSAGTAATPSNIAGTGSSHFVAYTLRAEDGYSQVYETNIETGQTTLVSATPSGAVGNSASDSPSVSPDGRFVVFHSDATDLIPGPRAAYGNLYVRDMQTGTTSLATSDANGTPIDTGDSYDLQLAPLKGLAITDHSVAFGEYVSESPADHNQTADIYIKDLDTGALTLASSGVSGTAAGTYALTADGKYVAYSAYGPNIVSGDTNGLIDTFLHRLVALDTLTLDPIAGDGTISASERSTALPVSGTASVIGGQVSVTVDGQQLGTAIVQADGTWSASIDVTGLAAGQHAFAARVHDLSGFTSSDGALVQLDAAAPSQRITISLAHDTGTSATDHITSDPSLVVGTSLAGDTILYSTDGTTFAPAPPAFASDGDQHVVVRTVDAHGSQTAEASFSFVLDRTADAGGDLAVAFDSDNGSSPGQIDAAHVAAASFTLTGLDAGASATVTFSGTGLDGQAMKGSVSETANGTYTVDLSGFRGGPVVASVSALDTAGNSATGTGDTSIVPCFVTGTRILTAHGEVPVEALSVGDLVVTASGEHRPIRWIGHRHTDCARHPEPIRVQPVRINAGAVAQGIPARDLRVSPDHALAFDGVLVKATRLVNGVSILRESVPSVTYWHVELDSHDLLVANGMPAESYIEADNRHAFENAGAVMQAHADFAALGDYPSRTCLPLVEGGDTLKAIRAGLFARVASRFAADPAVTLLADGIPLTPVSSDGSHFRFDIPEGANSLRLVSRSAMPSEVQSDSRDHRRFGVLVRKLVIDGLAVDYDVLGKGWLAQAPGRDHRWTDGDAALPPARCISFITAWLERYPVATIDDCRAAAA